MVAPLFYLNKVRSQELAQRLRELWAQKRVTEKYPREPVTNRRRVTKKYQHVFDDYHELIEEYNERNKLIGLCIDIIIALSYEVDRVSNPDKIDEIFTQGKGNGDDVR